MAGDQADLLAVGNEAGVRTASSSMTSRRLGYRCIKRGIDLVASSLLLVLTAPAFLVIALMIRLSGRGGVFFVQPRVGQHGEMFTLVKFRTMRPGTAEDVLGDPVMYEAYTANDFKLPPDDDRITRVGRLLRKSSLDELPQLLNILSGQMSLVGIRPLVEAEFRDRSPGDRELYTSIRPGLTGLWQVAGRSRLEGVERRELDRRYAQECSTAMDIRIMLRTPVAVLRVADTH